MNPTDTPDENSVGKQGDYPRLHGEFQRIRTPYLYPDGDNIDVFCKPQEGVTLVTDLGETTRWLRMQTVSPRRSPKQKALITDICQTHGVEFYKEMLMARCEQGDPLPLIVCRVGQAALRVSDLGSCSARNKAELSKRTEAAK